MYYFHSFDDHNDYEWSCDRPFNAEWMHGGFTIAIDPLGCGAAISICSHVDRFDRKKGRAVAENRLPASCTLDNCNKQRPSWILSCPAWPYGVTRTYYLQAVEKAMSILCDEHRAGEIIIVAEARKIRKKEVESE